MKKMILLFLVSTYLYSNDCNIKKNTFALVELYTSEGCSSCPSAEKNLNELSKLDKSKKIYPLAFHVDYWDYIGWKDIYAKQAYSNRQRDYAEKFNSPRVYTPQMILNGKLDILGSSNNEIQNGLEQELKKNSSVSIEIKTKTENEIFKVEYKISCLNKKIILNLATVQKGIQTKVSKGENSGKYLQHENVVIDFKQIQNANMNGEISLANLKIPKEKLEYILYIQDETTFEVLGANSFQQK